MSKAAKQRGASEETERAGRHWNSTIALNRGLCAGLCGVCVYCQLWCIRAIENQQGLMGAAYGPLSAWSPVALENGKQRKGWDLWYTGPARASWK